MNKRAHSSHAPQWENTAEKMPPLKNHWARWAWQSCLLIQSNLMAQSQSKNRTTTSLHVPKSVDTWWLYWIFFIFCNQLHHWWPSDCPELESLAQQLHRSPNRRPFCSHSLARTDRSRSQRDCWRCANNCNADRLPACCHLCQREQLMGTCLNLLPTDCILVISVQM